MKIEIVGLPKKDVLLALYNNAKFAGKGFESQPMLAKMASMSPPGNREMAEKMIDEALENNCFYFDYIDLGAGPRPIKVNLSGFDFDPTLYDRDHGTTGYAAAIIEQLRIEYVSQLQSEPKDSFASLLAQVGSVFMLKDSQNLDDSDEDFDADAAVESSFGKK